MPGPLGLLARPFVGALLVAAPLAPSPSASASGWASALAPVSAVAASPALAPAPAQTRSFLRVSLRRIRHGSLASLTVSVGYEDPQADVPSPVRRVLLRLPEGLNIEVPRLRSCSPSTLRAHGPGACPAASVLGSGWAIAEAHAGSQVLSERIYLTPLVGPLIGLQPTFEVFARGYTPFGQRSVLAGRVVADTPPYGEDMAIAIPPIATLPLEPDASIAALSLSIGPPAGSRARHANAVVVPAHCPPAGLPFAVQSSFADGSVANASTVLPCP